MNSTDHLCKREWRGLKIAVADLFQRPLFYDTGFPSSPYNKQSCLPMAYILLCEIRVFVVYPFN